MHAARGRARQLGIRGRGRAAGHPRDILLGFTLGLGGFQYT